MCIMVVNPVDSVTGAQIDDLTISLQDSSGIILKNFDDSLLLFKPNPPQTDRAWFPYNHMLIRYGFAGDHYIRTLSCQQAEQGEIWLVLEDRSKSRGEKYKTVKIKLDPANFYQLHDNVGDWTKISKEKETPAPDEPFDKLLTLKLKR